MSGNTTYLSRNCGECDECCQVIAVAALSKPYHRRCVHQTDNGCAIYGNHPVECRDYGCTWLQGILPEKMRPDKIGILVDAEGGDEWLVLQECRKGALKSQVGLELFNWLSDIAVGLRGGVRIEPYGAHTGVSAKGERLPGLFKEIFPKVYLYVGIDEGGNAPIANRQSRRSIGTGRNDLCPCGSGKKYKRCCLRSAAGQ